MRIRIGDNSLNLKAGGSMANIDRGPRGYSAYEIAVQEGFVGTEEDWLASLVGPEGKQGKDGERGLEGPRGKEGPEGRQGEKGNDGYTPVKGVDYFTPQDIESLNIPSKTSDIQNDSGFIDRFVNNLANYTLKTNTGSLIELSIDNTDYVVTLKLKNQDGTVISTDTIDLPLESVVVGGRYDSTNKKIVLTLENGNTVDIPVGDLIAGLQTEITSQNKLASDLVDDTNSGNKFTNMSEKQVWNNKYDKPSSGIPKTDLASDVQTSLGKADSALQEHQDLSDYVKNTDYASSSKGGVIKTGWYNFQAEAGGHPYVSNRSYSNYLNDDNNSFISKGTLENVIAGKQLINQTTLDESQEVQDANIEENASNIDWLQTLVNQMPTVSGQGTDLSLQDVLNYRLMKFLPQGNSSQFSTRGVQLFDKNNANILNKTALGGSQNLIYSTTSNSKTLYISCEENTTYTISKLVSSRFVVATCEETPQIGASLLSISTDHAATSMTVTTPSGAHYLLVWYYREDLETLTEQQILDSIQIEQGSTATSYEPYTGGIPAPNSTYPYMPSRVTGENSIVIQSENLFDGELEYGMLSQTTGNPQGTATDRKRTKNYVNVENINEVTLNFSVITSSSAYGRFFLYDKEYNMLSNTQIAGNTKTVNVENAYYAKWWTSDTVDYETFMLVKGSTAPSTYVEHEEQDYQLSLGNIELNSSPDGTIRDQIVGKPNEWYKREYIGKLVLDGSESWGLNNSGETDYFYQLRRVINFPSVNSGFCNKYICGVVIGNNNTTEGLSMIIGSAQWYIRIRQGAEKTIENFKDELSENNAILYYPLAQYTDIPITDTALISQLNDIYENAHSYNGTTNITTTYEDGNEQMYLDIEALKSWGVI